MDRFPDTTAGTGASRKKVEPPKATYESDCVGNAHTELDTAYVRPSGSLGGRCPPSRGRQKNRKKNTTRIPSHHMKEKQGHPTRWWVVRRPVTVPRKKEMFQPGPRARRSHLKKKGSREVGNGMELARGSSCSAKANEWGGGKSKGITRGKLKRRTSTL